jgi:hypothetical protein
MLTKHVLSYADNIGGGRQKKHQHPMLTPTGDNCGDPFLQPGILTSNAWDRSQNFWKPFNKECPPYRQYLQDVIDRDPLPFLQNKTLLMIGDSVDRNNLRFFCELVGSWDTRVTTMANLSEVFMGDTALHPWNTDPKDLTRPRICRVEEYDFEIINFFHYGLQDEETWTEKEVYTAPGVIEQRIPLLKQLFEDYGRTPDMIILASGRPLRGKLIVGLWDLAGYIKEDAYAAAPVVNRVEPERIEHWIERGETFVDMVTEMFPDAFTVWRTLHYCVVCPHW